jgi:hypothetical protein
LAENILKLFDEPCPVRFAVCGKGPSLDTFIADMELANDWGAWCIVAINDAVEVLPADYHVWQDWRYTKTKPPPGCVPIRQVKWPDKFNTTDGGEWRHLGYTWTNGKEWVDPFFPFREVRDIRGGIGILGEWTTGKAIMILGEWLRRAKKTAELLIVGCDAFDDHLDTAIATSLPDGQKQETSYAKSSEMLGIALQKYTQFFHTVRWYHRELQCRTTQLQPS